MVGEVSRESPSPSDDDEEDRRILIPDNEVKSHASNSRFLPPFQIDSKRGSSLRRCFGLSSLSLKKCLLCALIPLLVVLLYLSLGSGSSFPSSKLWNANFAGSFYTNQMMESELRALNLLREQQLGLVSVYKTIGSNYSVNMNEAGDSNATELAAGKDIKAKIFDQITTNSEIQKVLLSTHDRGNVDVSALGVDQGNLTSGAVLDMCTRVNAPLPSRRTIEWIPRSDRYLFAICLSGQMSNHLICLEKHIFFAALLKRVLVMPSPKFDYDYSRVLDIEHINKCLGKTVVITFEEFAQTKKNGLGINRFICYFPDCYMDEDHVKKLKGIGLSLPKLESPWTDDVKNPKKRTVQDFVSKFSSDDEVIAIGDVFFSNLEQEWVMQPGGPIAHKCKTLIEPSRLIMLTAQRFVQTFLGREFAALHFRRHGFLKFCNVKKESCFFPVPQAAECLRRVVGRAETPIVYLSTDAAESETDILQSLMVVDGKPIPLVKRPPRNAAEKWDALLYRHGLGDDSQVDAMLDKTISALSSVFIGAPGSTFTEDILRLRKGWGTASSCDEYICQGEIPNFIADVE